MRRIYCIAAIICCFATSSEAIPPAARDAERTQLALEVDQLTKKNAGLARQLDLREAHLRRRLRALYRLSQGGYLRLLLESQSPAELVARRAGLRRVVERDLGELRDVRAELAELDGDRARLKERERRMEELDAAPPDEDPGLARPGALAPPTAGAITARFGAYRDPSGLQRTRDAVELAAHPGEPVRAAAAGTVLAITAVPGLGRAVVIDHGRNFTTLTGRLDEARVSVGDAVAAGQPLGTAAGPTVAFQLALSGVPLDPAPYLAAPH